MIDGNLLQTAQKSFDFEGRIAVKSTVTAVIPREARTEAECARFIIFSVKELRQDQILWRVLDHISDEGVWRK